MGLVVHLKHGRESQLLLVGPKRTYVVTQLLGQHGDGAVHQIDGSAPVVSLFVDGRSRRHVIRHVGDVHAYLPMAIGQLLERNGIVEVLGVGRVDGDGEDVTEVLPFLDFRLLNLSGYLFSFLFDLLRKFQRIVVRQQDRFHLHVVVAWIAQHPDDFAKGVARVLRPVHQVHHYLLTVAGTVQLALGHKDVDRYRIHVGCHKHIPVRDVQHPHEVGTFPLKHLHNLTFGLLALALRKHGHLHPVPMQGLSGVACRNEHIIAFTVVQNHVGFARRLHVDRAFHILLLGAVNLQIGRVQHVTIRPLFQQDTLLEKIYQDMVHHVLAGCVANTQHLAYLLIVHRLERRLTINAQNGIGENT